MNCGERGFGLDDIFLIVWKLEIDILVDEGRHGEEFERSDGEMIRGVSLELQASEGDRFEREGGWRKYSRYYRFRIFPRFSRAQRF